MNGEEAAKAILPMLSKTKISNKLSYPLGAKDISLGLIETPQFRDLKLHFYFWSDNHLRWRHYEFLRAEYLNNSAPASEWPIGCLYKRPPQWRWEIIVQPVPRILRHQIKRHAIESALPKIREWLNERAGLQRRGSDILTFFYDEKKEEFEVRTLTKLEPVRS